MTMKAVVMMTTTRDTYVSLVDDIISAWRHAVNTLVTMTTPLTSPWRRRTTRAPSTHTHTVVTWPVHWFINTAHRIMSSMSQSIINSMTPRRAQQISHGALYRSSLDGVIIQSAILTHGPWLRHSFVQCLMTRCENHRPSVFKVSHKTALTVLR